MIISFSPQRRDDALTLEKTSGDRLRINGELFNFDPLEDGWTIPAGAIPCEWIVGPVDRIDGVVHLTLILPHGAQPETWQAFPAAIDVTDDGPVDIPVDTIVEHELRRAEGGAERIRITTRWKRSPEEEVVEFLPDPAPVETRVEVEGGYEIVTTQERILAEPLEISREFFAYPEPAAAQSDAQSQEETDHVEP